MSNQHRDCLTSRYGSEYETFRDQGVRQQKLLQRKISTRLTISKFKDGQNSESTNTSTKHNVYCHNLTKKKWSMHSDFSNYKVKSGVHASA